MEIHEDCKGCATYCASLWYYSNKVKYCPCRTCLVKAICHDPCNDYRNSVEKAVKEEMKE